MMIRLFDPTCIRFTLQIYNATSPTITQQNAHVAFRVRKRQPGKVAPKVSTFGSPISLKTMP